MNSLVLISKKSKNHLFYLIIFIGVFLFPVNNSTLISGIPLINKYVTIISLTFIPLIFFRTSVFKYNIIKILTIILLLLKTWLFFSPENGIAHKQYFSEKDYQENNYIKTYHSFWKPNYSSIQKTDWVKKENFPIDWVYPSKMNFLKDGTYYFMNLTSLRVLLDDHSNENILH